MTVRVHFLGSGNAFSDGGRANAAIHVTAPGVSLLLDCGGSALPAIKKHVDPATVDAIAVTHLHGDHFGGIPFFILDGQFLSRRERPLLIAGPPGIDERVRQAQEALFAGSSQTQQKYEMHFLEWHDRRKEGIGGISVTPFEVVHASGAPPFALRLEVDGKTIAYSGDTEWTHTLIELARGADLFICEANFYEKNVKFHLDYQTLMDHKDELRCKRLVLTHMNVEMLARLPSLDVEAAEDGTEIVL